MDSVISDLGSSLRLTEEEEDGITIPKELCNGGSDIGELDLISRVLTKKNFNLVALQSTMSDVWSPVNGIEVRQISGGRLIFSFKHLIDKKRALEGGPWCFDRKLIILNTISGDENPSQVDLNWSEFNVIVSGLPWNNMNREVAKLIGNKIGKFISILFSLKMLSPILKILLKSFQTIKQCVFIQFKICK
ncbi:hypothetical protein ACJIZ3_021616 [Penstemon smallii]|uniref:DUF4283 domain-containing protein n=1 Tax=Penstemon smallii TaxID=265156 RepID=A0ABD3SLY1_9LAMI